MNTTLRIPTILGAACSVLFALQGAAAELTVSAAASLTNAFTEIATSYEGANPGSRVLLNFGSSGSLLQQVARGAPVDVFASADQDTMDRAQKQNLILDETRRDFAANALVLVVPAKGDSFVSAAADLTKPSVARIAVGIPDSVPAGRYAKEALTLQQLWEPLKDKFVYGQNVRQVLDYVARGEVDAGVVYATDAAIMKNKVRVVGVLQTRRPILYPIAVVRGGGSENAGRRFAAFVLSDQGRQILERHGFSAP